MNSFTKKLWLYYMYALLPEIKRFLETVYKVILIEKILINFKTIFKYYKAEFKREQKR